MTQPIPPGTPDLGNVPALVEQANLGPAPVVESKHRLVNTELVAPMTSQCVYTCACGFYGRAWRWNDEHVPATGVAPIPPAPPEPPVSRDALRRAIYGDRRRGGTR